MKKDNQKNQYRVNGQIHVREVRVVSDDGSQVMPTRQALDLAHQQGVDLVEISPNAQPPVCRLIDYSKFLYQQKKRAKEMKQNRCVWRSKRSASDLRPTTTTTSSSSSTPRNSSKRATRCAPTCFSVVVPSFSRNRVRCCCCALPMTWRSMPR